MDEPGDAPVTTVVGAVAGSVDSIWAKMLTRFIVPAMLAALSLLAHSWFSQLDETQHSLGMAVEAVVKLSDATHRQIREFRDETAQARVLTADRLKVIETETAHRLDAIQEENRNLSNQIKEIEPRVKEIEQKVKGQ